MCRGAPDDRRRMLLACKHPDAKFYTARHDAAGWMGTRRTGRHHRMVARQKGYKAGRREIGDSNRGTNGRDYLGGVAGQHGPADGSNQTQTCGRGRRRGKNESKAAHIGTGILLRLQPRTETPAKNSSHRPTEELRRARRDAHEKTLVI
eukprot:2677414-Pyramimonas_sp.AAC.1